MVAGGCVSIIWLALVYAVSALTETKIGTVGTGRSLVQRGCFWKRPMERITVMSDKTGIAWTDSTWNPVTGCSKVSKGCKHCYAEREWGRLSANPKATAYYGRAFTDVACHEDRLDQPLRWKKPRMIFVNSMSDLFHEDVPDAFIDRVFAVMALAEKHTFQVLTKRTDRMRDYLSMKKREDLIGDVAMPQVSAGNFGVLEWPLPNVWLGVSVEDQAAADERIPVLLRTPAAVRWISAEPLIGPIDMAEVPVGMSGPLRTDGGTGPDTTKLSWVVCGGELRTSPLFIDMLKPCNSKENSSFNMSIEMDGLMDSH